MRIKFFLILFLVSGYLNLTCGAYPDYSTLFFSNITQKQGLSHDIVDCIFKDSDGFIWFGTRNGLCRFDGYDLKIFRTSHSKNSISGDRILCINEDKSGNIWIGTYASGLNKFDKSTEGFTHYGVQKSINERVNRIKVLKDGTLWVCTSYGLAQYLPDADSFRLYNNSNNPGSLNSNTVHDITETRDGKIYVATENSAIQLFNRNTGEFTSVEYKRSAELNSNYRKRILEDNNGILWISASVHGLVAYNPRNGTSEIYVKGEGQLSSNVLGGDMALDPNGNLWVCTDGGGINILNTKTRKFSYLTHDANIPGSISSDHVYTVYFDNANIVWIGTFGKGVNFFDPNRYKFSSQLLSPGDLKFFENKSIISLFQDSKGRIWIGTDGQGLYMFDKGGRLKSFFQQPANPGILPINVITSINEDNNGNILVGTYSGGLISFNPEKGNYTWYNQLGNTEKNISALSIWHIFPDSKNRIWLGLLSMGADLFNPDEKTFVNFGPRSSRADKIGYQNMMTILEDSDGDIWFGTEGNGLYILDSETDKIYRIDADSSKNVLIEGIIRCLFQDRLGYIWIGTEGDGLYKFDKKTNNLDHFTVANGLSSNIIQSVLEDIENNLWIGTNFGLNVYDANTNSFRYYLQDDGLTGNSFNQNVLIQLADGRFMAGTTNGIDVFRPEEILINQNLPRVVLTKLDVLNQEVKPGIKYNNRVILQKSITHTSDLVLTYKDKIITLEFAALTYTLPEKCIYQYMLDGFDDTWITASSNRRTVSYSNLQPGNYVFKVRASNNDGKWGNNIRTLNIKVLPPFYKTWWFRMFAIIALIAVIYFVYSYRLNMHKDRFRQNQIIQERKIMHLEKEKLESELQKLTFHVLNRNRALIDQKNRLIGLSMKAREVVRIGLQDIINNIDAELNDDKDWVHIEPQLDKVYNNFVSRLKEKYPDLTLSEIKIAAYVRMNMSTKEISEFMHKTTRAVENDRYRLRKKIGLDSNESLQSYLMSL